MQLDELARIPAFTVPSLGLPLLTFLTFGLPTARRDEWAAAGSYIGFASFALLGIVMFQFGVGLATERASPWERYVRTLPSSAAERFVARLAVALLFGVASLVPVTVAALIATPLHLDAVTWARVLAALLLGAVPLGLLGIMLGYLLNERGALPVTNLVYLPLAYLGGLFGSGVGDLPHLARQLAPWLPTRQWSDLVVRFGLGGRLPLHATLALVAYGLAFALLAGYGYRRDEARHYR